MAKKITPETALKKAARDLLALYRIWTFPILQGLGAMPGIPDRLGIYRGKPLALEFKAPKGRLSHAQMEFRDKFQAEGGIWIEVRSVEDLAKGLGIKLLMGC